MPLFLGLDCGGSSTRALVLDDAMRTVFEGRGGPANLSSTPLDTVRASVSEAMNGCPPVDAVVGCFAGLLGAEKRAMALDLLKEIAPGSKRGCHADYVAPLGLSRSMNRVVVTAGTGSVVSSWGEQDPVKSLGGGPLLGDDGSAFDVARQVIRGLCVLANKSLPCALLSEALEIELGSSDIESLPAVIAGLTSPARSLGRLCPVIGRLAREGDALCDEAVQRSMDRLCGHVVAHCDRYLRDEASVDVVMTGGLWLAHDVFEASFRKSMERVQATSDPIAPFSRQYHVERLSDPPVLGAAQLAMNLFYGH